MMPYSVEKFQSTLPARGATRINRVVRASDVISIHAPRTGSDAEHQCDLAYRRLFQSTLPARGATYHPGRKKSRFCISIHAPRTGSDREFTDRADGAVKFQSTLPARGATHLPWQQPHCADDFNPRSPHGERHLWASICPLRTYFNPRSPHGERRHYYHTDNAGKHFNPRSPHGERLALLIILPQDLQFQSTLPARGATLPV